MATLELGVDEVIRKARRPLADTPATGDLAAVARERAAFWLPLAEDQGREVDVDVPGDPLLVPAPEDELAAVLDALIGNVLDHTPHGVPFRVSVTRAADDREAGDGTARLTVTDHGPGIPLSTSPNAAPAAPVPPG